MVTDIVEAKIPISIATNFLEKVRTILDFGRNRINLCEKEVEKYKVGSGYFLFIC